MTGSTWLQDFSFCLHFSYIPWRRSSKWHKILPSWYENPESPTAIRLNPCTSLKTSGAICDDLWWSVMICDDLRDLWAISPQLFLVRWASRRESLSTNYTESTWFHWVFPIFLVLKVMFGKWIVFFGPGNPHISQPKVPLVSGDFPTDPLVWTMTLAMELIHQLTEIWTRFRRLRQGTSSETWSKWGAMAHGLLGIPSSMLHGNPPKKARNITICRWLNTVWELDTYLEDKQGLTTVNKNSYQVGWSSNEAA